MKNNKIKIMLFIICYLILLQLLLFCFEHIAYVFIERTYFTDYIASMFGMIILSVTFILFANKQKIPLSVFPERFNKFYIVGTCIAIALLVSSPANYSGGYQAIILMVYFSVVTPIYEELIFRGYIWNRFNDIFEKEWITFIVTSFLFAIWHLGYIDSIAFRTETGLVIVMVWKVITGLCYGVILGSVRLKTKNSYSTMLLHGVMNIFGR